MKHRLSIPTTFQQIAARISLAVVLSIAGFFATPAGLVQAASITVNTTADEYGTGVNCSLREAITAANNDAAFGGCSAGSGADTISLPTGIYTLTIPNASGLNEDDNSTGDLDINTNLTITGAGSGSTIIQAGFSAGAGIDKVLAINPYCINPVNAVIDGVTIRYGRNTQASGSADFSQTGGGLDYCGVGNGSFVFINSIVSDNTNVYGYGGGMNVDGITGHIGSITIDHVTFSNNQTLSSTFDSTGGALNLFGYQPVINITNSTFQNNSSPSNRRGGAIHYRPSYGGSLQVNNSIFTNNSAGEGGALALITTGLPSPVTIQNSLINGNIASGIGIGGGISSDRPLTLVNNTITANSASTQGGGIANYGTMTMGHTTISGNSAPSGAGIYNGAGTATLINSIIANHTGPDCTNIASLNASDHTLIEDNTCSPSLSGAPLLSALGTYGGVTQTMALLPGSKAIDAGGNSGCTLTDQRGVARPVGSGCDIGAFESNGFTLGSLSGSGQSATINSAFTNPLGLTVTANNAGEPVNGGTVTFTPPGSGASAAISGSPATISGGTASVTATANGTAGGPYNVAAITPGVSIPVNFALTNTPSQLSINDVSANEGNSGTTTFTFTVSLPAPAPAGGVTFDIATANGTATVANSDYLGLATTGAAIAAGNTSTPFIVTVNGDLFNEGDENFYVNISNVTNAVLLDGQGVGTIVNDDTSPDPMVINFSATSPSTSVDIPITVFTAFDDVAVTGFMITNNPTPPGAGDSGWVGSVPTTYTVSTNGTYTLYPWTKDADGHVSALFGSPVTVVVDTISPDTSITSLPTTPTNTTSASFTFVGNDMGGSGVAGFECALDGPSYAPCLSGYSISGLSDGIHTLLVHAIDNAGWIDASPASYTWVVDTGAPTTSITSNPSNPTASNSAAFSFTGADTGGSGVAGFECDLDGAGFSACSTGQNYPGLSNGSHTFQVRSVDNAGNKDATPASFTWVVDTTTPDTIIDSTPASLTNNTTANFTFHGDDGSGTGVAGFECDMGSGYSACTSPKGYNSLTDGSHTFRVRGIDTLGNIDATPASYTWIVDTTGPTALMTSTATNPTNLSSIPVTITFTEPVCGFNPTPGADLLVTNGAASALTSGSNGSSVYTFNVTPALQGQVSIYLYTGSVYDGDCVTPLNYNSVDSPTFNITYDSVSPIVVIDQKAGQPDPTNASPINFTVTFNQAVTDFATGDVDLSASTAPGTLSAVVNGSGTTYNIAVSGMTGNGAVIALIPAGAAQDAAGNPNTASTSTDNTVTYIAGPLNVTVNQATGQIDPTNSLPLNFTVVFSRPIDTATFTSTDVTLGGTAPGTMTAVITEIAPNDGTTFNIAVSGMTGTGSVTAIIAASRVQDPGTNNNDASTSTDNSVMYDPGVPTISGTNLKATLSPGPTNITVKFNEAVYDNPISDIETDDVTNPNNYFLLEKGANGVSERTACNVPPQPPSDDVYISVDHVDYDIAIFTATLSINGGIALPLGSYELFVCGTTSIVDLAGNAINNGLSDYTYNFRVIAARASLPATGFAPDRVTILPAQPESKAYGKEDMWLEIPALGIKQPIVGIPKQDGWDVSWLGNQIGYLNGTAYPTWAGNSVLTGHVTNSNGDPGPFTKLGTLKWGDRVIIHAFGQEYIYEIRSVDRWTDPKDTRILEKHEELPWVTMITCTGYDEKTGTYRWRTVVRAVQIRIENENRN